LRTSSTAALVLLWVCVGCGGTKMTWQQQLDSPAGVERAQGVMTVGEQNIQPAIPQLIDLLEDDDVSVRVVTVRTLRDMTGKEFGYVAYADAPERRAAAGRWRTWWQSQTGTGATPATPETPETPETGGEP